MSLLIFRTFKQSLHNKSKIKPKFNFTFNSLECHIDKSLRITSLCESKHCG